MSRQPDAFVHSAVFIRDLELLHPKPIQLVWKGKVLFHTSHHASGWGGPFCVRSWNRQNQMKEPGTSIPLPWQNQKRTCGRTPQRRTQTIPEGLSCDILYTVTRAEPGNTQPHEAWLQRSCVQEAVVHQLQHDPVQAVMTAVGNCYVSVLFRSLQE